jgi:hypothetical protein
MKIASRVLFVVACVIAASSVLLAAYVAHQGEALSPASLKSLQSALQLQQIHALALAGVCAVALLHTASKTFRLASTTAAPALAKVFANWAPKPLEAPVTNATRPDKSRLYAIVGS